MFELNDREMKNKRGGKKPTRKAATRSNLSLGPE